MSSEIEPQEPVREIVVESFESSDESPYSIMGWYEADKNANLADAINKNLHNALEKSLRIRSLSEHLRSLLIGKGDVSGPRQDIEARNKVIPSPLLDHIFETLLQIRETLGDALSDLESTIKEVE